MNFGKGKSPLFKFKQAGTSTLAPLPLGRMINLIVGREARPGPGRGQTTVTIRPLVFWCIKRENQNVR
jgi:hypothetical protein